MMAASRELVSVLSPCRLRGVRRRRSPTTTLFRGNGMDSASDPEINLTDPMLYSHGDPYTQWRWLRAHDPVHWSPPGEFPGFFSLTRYADVRAAYRDEALSSAGGILLRPVGHGDDP